MKQRKIYWRRKQGKIIAEGKRNNKTIFLFTLPEPEVVAKSSLLPIEKRDKILEKISRLDIKSDNDTKASPEVRTINIRGTPEKDDLDEDPFDLNEELTELTERVEVRE